MPATTLVTKGRIQLVRFSVQLTAPDSGVAVSNAKPVTPCGAQAVEEATNPPTVPQGPEASET